MPVRLLEDSLVDQIAAGEVVERPASVVKELVENSLDAGATTLKVQLRAGGRELIRVVDDGEGMDRHDALMCLERHATSKIVTLDDLVHVRTLGFRGEAIPSIGSVSRFEILTRRHDADVGTRVRVEGGTLGGVSDAGCAPGTQITVRDLFFNLPVRQAFLRTAPTELGHCVEAVVRQAMLRPDVDVLVTHEGREAVRAPRTADRAARVRALLGKPADALREVEVEDRGVSMVGLASPAGVHQNSAKGVFLYVNGRYVRDPVLRRGLREAYQGIVPRGRHPVVVLEIRVADEDVDVNVHPSKTEVRFRNPRVVAEVVAGGLREALRRHGIRREIRDDAFGSRTRRPDPAALPLPLDGLPAHPDDDPRFVAAEPPARPEPELPPWLVSDVRPPTPGPDAPASLSQDRGPPAEQGPPTQELQEPLDGPRPQDVQPLAVVEPQRSQVAAGPDDEPSTPSGPPPVGALDRVHDVDRAVTLAAGRGGLYAIDLVALRRALARADLEDDGAPRRLLVPRIVEAGSSAAARLVLWQDALDAIGVSVGAFGGGQIALKRVPAQLIDADWDALAVALAARLPASPGPALPPEVLGVLVGAVPPPSADDIDALLVAGAHLPAAPPIARRLDAARLRGWIRQP